MDFDTLATLPWLIFIGAGALMIAVYGFAAINGRDAGWIGALTETLFELAGLLIVFALFAASVALPIVVWIYADPWWVGFLLVPLPLLFAAALIDALAGREPIGF